MQDANIANFWELELMMCTNSFNDPERFDSERLLFVEQGLLPVEEYHRTCLIAYMCNLNSEKAAEHFNINNPHFGIFHGIPGGPFLTREGAHFLVWQGKVPPHMEPAWNGMLPSRASAVWDALCAETWHVPVAEVTAGVCNGLGFSVDKKIAIDSWALFLLAARDGLEYLEDFDAIYITHSSVDRMMDEMCHYGNEYLRSILAYLEVSKNVKIQSPGFEHQLLVRDKAPYSEPASTIALALELGCPAVIGEPEVEREVVENFREVIIRGCELVG